MVERLFCRNERTRTAQPQARRIALVSQIETHEAPYHRINSAFGNGRARAHIARDWERTKQLTIGEVRGHRIEIARASDAHVRHRACEEVLLQSERLETGKVLGNRTAQLVERKIAARERKHKANSALTDEAR